jgi:indole-3-acetate monooxygenase
MTASHPIEPIPTRLANGRCVGQKRSSGRTSRGRPGVLINLARGKPPRGRPVGLLCENPRVRDAVGRANAILNAGGACRTAMITELWNTIAAGNDTTLEQRARCHLASTYTADSVRQAMDLMYRAAGGQHVVQAR